MMERRSLQEQVLSGLLISLYLLLGIAVGAAFFGGIQAVVYPERVSPNSILLKTFQVGSHTFVSGWIYLAISFVALVLTMDRWVKILPGVFVYSTIRAIIMLSGRYNGRSVPRSEAWFTLFFVVLTAAVTWTFRERKLNILDRISLMTFLACLGLAMTPNPAKLFTFGSIGLGALVLAWLFNSFQHRGDHDWHPDSR